MSLAAHSNLYAGKLWRDVQQLQGGVGRYLISDRPLTEDEWIEQRTKLEPKDVTPALPDSERSTEKPGRNNDLEDSGT